MFYCDKCAAKRGWPFKTMFRSRGTCEICGKTTVCNDMRSKDLPLPIPNEDEPECM
jgi:hypothetical protein